MIYVFGDLFRYENKEFVFLAQNTEHVYAALILDAEVSTFLMKKTRAMESGNLSLNPNLRDSPMFSFIVLKTPSHKDRAAVYGNPEKPEIDMSWMESIGALNPEDKEELRKEILNSGLAKAFKDHIASLPDETFTVDESLRNVEGI